LVAAFGCGVNSEQGGRIGSPIGQFKRSIPVLTQGARYVPRMPMRDAPRAPYSNQGARGAGSQQRRSPASDIVKRRILKQTELFPDLKLLGVQLSRVTLVPSSPVAKLADRIRRRVHVSH
jgi:hypothetical protein